MRESEFVIAHRLLLLVIAKLAGARHPGKVADRLLAEFATETAESLSMERLWDRAVEIAEGEAE